MSERVVSSALSRDVIDLLMKRGMTLTAIAHAIGVTKSFISRVRTRSRSQDPKYFLQHNLHSASGLRRHVHGEGWG